MSLRSYLSIKQMMEGNMYYYYRDFLEFYWMSAILKK
jgi:hypothetical protein